MGVAALTHSLSYSPKRPPTLRIPRLGIGLELGAGGQDFRTGLGHTTWLTLNGVFFFKINYFPPRNNKRFWTE